MLHPRGLMAKLEGLRCQFRGDSSQQMPVASLTTTSECASDSNTFAGEVMQLHLSHYFSSLTTDMNRDSQNPRVPAAQKGNGPGVRPFFLRLAHLSIPFHHQSMATLKKGDQRQMWEFIRV